MAANAPWSVKGIDPKTRETAKEIARRSGMTLGEWLNQRIQEESGAPEPKAKRASKAEPAAVAPAAKPRPAQPKARVRPGEAETAPARPEFGAQADRMAGLAQRLEGVEQRTTLAVTGLDQSMRGVLARLEQTERAQADTRTRMEDRVRKLEEDAAGPRSAEAIRTLEASFGKVANRAHDVEARMSDSLDDLRREVMALGRRLEDMERHKGASPEGRVLEQRMEQLAVTLTQRVEAAKAEMASAVEQAGARSAGAVERIGHEVLRMAESLDRRVQAVEHHASDAIEQVGGEVARAMGALDVRMQRSESAQAEALERLGGEIARITERLSERIGNAERRSAQAIDDVGEQVSRVTERLNSRYERTSSDLAERIKLSEERTARLLEEAKERIETRLAEAQRRASEQAAFAPAAEAAPAPQPFGGASYADPFAASPPPVIYPDAAPFGQTFAPADFVPAEPDFAPEDLAAADNLATPLEPQTEADFMSPAPAAEEDDLTLQAPPPPEAFETFEAAAPEPEAVEPEPFAPAAEAIEDEPFQPRQLASPSTREMIEQARAAARAAAQNSGKVQRAPKGEARGRMNLAMPSFLGGKKSNLKNALMMSAAGLALLVAVSGYVAISGGFKGKAPARVAANVSAGNPGEYAGPEADTTPITDALPQAAVALDPRPIGPSAVNAYTPAPPPANAAALYNEGAQKIESGDKAGLAAVLRAANLGLPAAQAYLGRLYEKGAVGLAKNPAEARKWYERAAQAGDRSAMHNLALYYFEGSGGPKNLTVAAEWFRRAAMAGLTDSQYNLGRLYENGLGVAQNPAEAYKWYLLAERGGTEQQRAEAREAAGRVGALISADARVNAEKSASEIAAQAEAAQTLQAQLNSRPWAGAADVATAQKALIKLGYFKGVADGQMSASLRLAVQGFQRDKNLPATGQLDPATDASLATYNR